MGKTGRRSVNTSEEEGDMSSSSRTRDTRARKSGNSPSRGGASTSSTTGGGSKKKKKSSSKFNKVVIETNKIAPSLNLMGLVAEFRSDPARVGKRIGTKVLLYGVVISTMIMLLSMIGVSIPGSGLAASLFSSKSIPPIVALDGDGNEVDADVSVPPEEGEEEIPEMVGFVEKKSMKTDRAKEKILACNEVDCTNACIQKTTPKCLAKKSCKADREKLCKRRCLKARCEERCKDEPKYGYVEREQKMDKCKEGCQGSTAAHNKCIKKCHSEFKPCKSRCHEISSKYKCDTKSVESSSLVEPLTSKVLRGNNDKEEEEEQEEEEEEHESVHSSSQGANTFDDEVI